MSIAEALSEFAPSLTGQLLQPSDGGYGEARRVHNGLVDKRPAVIARCRGVADIVDAVKLAKASNLEVAVRGGGHNVAGRATIDDGLMIDLSLMKGIHVDPSARTARAQGGVLWKKFNRETQVASTRVGLTDTACTLRTPGFDVVILSQWSNPRDTETCTQWCRDTYSALKPFLGPTRYMNYLAHDESDARAVYGPNDARLQELKRKYDPENFFHTNVNIRPA